MVDISHLERAMKLISTGEKYHPAMDADVADGALRYEFVSPAFTATATLDPEALATRVLNDAAKFIGNAIGHIRGLFAGRASRTTVGT